MATLDHGSYAVNGEAQAVSPVKTADVLALIFIDAGVEEAVAAVCTSAAQVLAITDGEDVEALSGDVASYVFGARVPEVVCILAGSAADAAAALGSAYRLLHRKINLVWTNSTTAANFLALASAAQDVIGPQSYDAIVYADLPWDAGWTDADATTAAAIATAAGALPSHPKNLALHAAQVKLPASQSGGTGSAIGSALSHVVRQIQVDAQNADVPYEGSSNYELPGVVASIPLAFSREDGNTCNAAGVNTVIYDDGYKLWGDYLSSYNLNSTTDADGVFIQQQRMLQYLRAQFVAQWKSSIDRAFTRQLADTIIATEQAKLDRLVARGALIGNPRIEFLPADNPNSEILQGHFFWRMAVSPSLPMVSAKLSVAFTDSGYAALFE